MSMKDESEMYFGGKIQKKLYKDLELKKKVKLASFLYSYANPDVGKKVLNKMISLGVARMEGIETVVYVPPERRNGKK